MTSLEALYGTHRRTFVSKIRPYVRSFDVAEDLVQEAFTRAVDKLSQFNPKKGSLKGWFTKILFSLVWSHLRTLKKTPPMYDIDLVLESDLLAYEEEPNLRKYVAGVVNVKHKQVLLGHFLLGYSYKELAAMLDMTQDNTRKVVQRFRDAER